MDFLNPINIFKSVQLSCNLMEMNLKSGVTVTEMTWKLWIPALKLKLSLIN